MQVRFTPLALDDIRNILDTSALRHGDAARDRYRALLGTAFRQIETSPTNVSSAACDDLAPGIRRLHLARCRQSGKAPRVANPVHVVFYKQVAADAILIVRVMHERMEPSRHLQDGETP